MERHLLVNGAFDIFPRKNQSNGKIRFDAILKHDFAEIEDVQAESIDLHDLKIRVCVAIRIKLTDMPGIRLSMNNLQPYVTAEDGSKVSTSPWVFLNIYG